MGRSRYPCGICDKGAKFSAIKCTSCMRWYHSRCLRLPKRYLMTLTKREIRSWECNSCADGKVQTSDWTLSYDCSSLDDLPLDLRIKLCSSILKLRRISTALNESSVVLLDNSSVAETDICTLSPLKTPETETHELQKYEDFEEGIQEYSDISEDESVTQPTIQTGEEAMDEDPYEFTASPAKKKTRTKKRTARDEAAGSSTVTDEELLARDAGPSSAAVALAPPTEILSERFQAFKSSLVEVFRAERASSLSLARVVQFANNAQSGAAYEDGEVSAAIERLTEANQVMHADGILFLI